MLKQITGVVGATVLMMGLAGCTTSSDATTEDPVVFSGSVPVHYVEAEQLAGDAVALVHGSVVASSEAKLDDLVVTRYDLRIDQTLGGDVSGTVGIYQTGTSDWILDLPIPQHLEVGDSYLLFLTPMGLPEGSAGSDGFAILGPGVWVDRDGSLEAYGNPNSEIDYGQIPLRFSLDEAPTLLNVSALGSSR